MGSRAEHSQPVDSSGTSSKFFAILFYLLQLVLLCFSVVKSSTYVRFVHAFFKAIVVIIVSEIGDKTFFIAAIFAMKHARSTVFAGAIGALGLMTFLSGKLHVF